MRSLEDYGIIARGPHAGFLCMHAMDKKKCRSLIIQARGLIAEEYKYTHTNKKSYTKIFHNFRYKQFKQLEKGTYSRIHLFPKTKIEAVSAALKEYIIRNFKTHERNITIAKEDIPPKVDKNIIAKWRHETRKKLNISQKNVVYCYNGSIKPWQCPEMVIDFFEKKIKDNPSSFLLVFTQNKNQFEQLIYKKNIPLDKYMVKTVNHDKIYQYLSACDYGMIFRKKSIINWVSRPTKVLEYEAVRLNIIHNHTVKWLNKP
jgi:hypothetical protein